MVCAASSRKATSGESSTRSSQKTMVPTFCSCECRKRSLASSASVLSSSSARIMWTLDWCLLSVAYAAEVMRTCEATTHESGFSESIGIISAA